jgi:hypothetical protein
VGLLAGTLKNATIIKLNIIGIINGGIDLLVTAASYPDMAYNNTYDLLAITKAQYPSAIANLTNYLAFIRECQELVVVYDPENHGNNVAVNSACSGVYS